MPIKKGPTLNVCYRCGGSRREPNDPKKVCTRCLGSGYEEN